ncbi:MAG: hypothetical protein KBD55_00525 [Candidatus Pacebacteria bacterium]|jgi:hypothetical protein|nr:hypothetical protein [Candidatus Paceibacterota bacterium]
MKQATIKLKMYAGNVNMINNDMAIRILRSMLFASLALGFLYVIFLGNMVFNIVERKSLESQARNLSNQVGDLELTYLSLSNKIDLELSHSLGYRETTVKFATRKALGSNTLPTTLANNEI